MRKIFRGLLLVFAFGISAAAQTEGLTFESFTSELTSAKTVSDFNSIASKSETLHSEHKKQFGEKKEKMAKASLDFALFRKSILEKMNAKVVRPGALARDDRLDFLKLYRKNSSELERLFKETIKMYEKELGVETPELATAKFELARSKGKYILLRDSSSDWKTQLAYHSENQNLYLEAFTLREKLLDKNHALVLISAYYLANSYVESSDFEKALLYYEKYVAGYREKYGKDSISLLPALLMSSSIRNMVDDQESVARIAKEISAITKKKVDLGDNSLQLAPRARSFKYRGINPKRAFLNHQRPTGVTSRGTVEYADSMSIDNIRRRQTGSTPSFKVINPGRSSIKVANVVKVFVRVDTDGNVVRANAETKDSKIKEKVEKRIKKWKFRPFVYEGKPLAMEGFVNYYDI